MSEALYKAKNGGAADPRIIDDLSGVFADFDTAVGGVDDLGAFGRTDPLMLLAKIEQLRERGHRTHWGGMPTHLGEHIGHIVHKFHHLVNRNIQLERELEVLSMSSNVIVSTPIDNLAAATTSGLVTFGAPYSGIDFAITAMLLPAELTPPGRFSTLQFMGIDFATPSTSGIVVQYAAPSGTLGTPVVQGMGLSSFYTNLTAPRGHRVFEPWVGWMFDASAKVSFTVYNPSATLSATYLIDWMMRSSPCPQPGVSVFNPSMVRGHVQYHEGVPELFNAIHHAVIGMGRQLDGVGHLRLAKSGHQLLTAWANPVPRTFS
jgi:hypothetical protein